MGFIHGKVAVDKSELVRISIEKLTEIDAPLNIGIRMNITRLSITG
jgi:hypothetical protein